MKLSVILPCFNGAATIAAQLEALAHQQWNGDWEVIVSNNGSTDHSMDIVEQYRDRLPNLKIVNAYIPPAPHLGVAHSYNVGIQAATGDAFAFCESDDQVTPTWLATLAAGLSQNDFVTGPLDYQKLNPAWMIPVFGSGTQQDGLVPVEYHPGLPFFYGCNVGFRRSVYELIGELDEAIRYAWDMDYSWRVQIAGFQIHFLPELKIHYRLRHTLSGLYRQSRNWSEDQVLMRKLYQCPTGKMPWIRHSIEALLHLLQLPRISNHGDFAGWLYNWAWHVGRVWGELKYHLLGQFDERQYIVSRQRHTDLVSRSTVARVGNNPISS
jgi:glycosyltransferase involved in cell wall biosynthesis